MCQTICPLQAHLGPCPKDGVHMYSPQNNTNVMHAAPEGPSIWRLCYKPCTVILNGAFLCFFPLYLHTMYLDLLYSFSDPLRPDSLHLFHIPFLSLVLLSAINCHAIFTRNLLSFPSKVLEWILFSSHSVFVCVMCVYACVLGAGVVCMCSWDFFMCVLWIVIARNKYLNYSLSSSYHSSYYEVCSFCG